jgi:photosystem II stability/assembly factor-like uncharacterized protein
MNARSVRLAALLLVSSTVGWAGGVAGQEIWTPERFENDAIYSLAVGPSGTLYAGTSGGVYQSIYPGYWTLIPGSPANSTSIVPHPSDPDTLYTGSSMFRHEGLFKTTDGGVHFQKLNRHAIGVHAIALDPAEPDTLYVGGEHPQVWKSTDAGSRWTAPISPGLVRRIRSIVIDPRSPNVVYAGSDAGTSSHSDGPHPPNAPVMRTVDHGAHWFPALEQGDHAPSPIHVTAMAIDGRSGTLYAAAIEYPAGISLFRTLNAGVRWARFPVGSRIAVGSIRALVVDPVVTNRLYAATEAGGVLQSDDGGATWL